ncbi:unnamed protein product [Acanthoscelides obtectus]|uniref:Uncharacterized protein n=1 Tax=Acanthoscelides obtectus TaxID=200917 RepID=A0A9P0KXG8_ACAOB|nr:unnamed protein product [Acanthoscelides obtectus]CAK1630067.1 hypothetical protein AOBTE_LOCUS6137 [Acanthoscelides obtectus]
MEHNSKVAPGWNDPPVLNYSSSNPPPKSRIMNKRVAFPLNTNNVPGSSIPSSSSMPPLPQPQEDMFQATRQRLQGLFQNEEALYQFCKDWQDDKINEDCKRTVYYLGKYLSENNKGEAEKMKLKLCSSYKDVCQSWLDFIKF